MTRNSITTTGEVMTPTERAQIERFIWSQENVELKTVGIDIGSSTSHLLFAKVTLQRQSQGLSSRFTVVDRQIMWRSPIIAHAIPPRRDDRRRQPCPLHPRCLRAGRLTRSEIDSGAVILTGEAIKRKNARAIDELFADEAGKFVCATAGHVLESRLAAQGSGAVRLSKQRGECLLHVDVGGGTTKLALIDQGVVLGVQAFAVGGRLIATDGEGAGPASTIRALVAEELGIATDPRTLADPAARRAIACRLAQVAVDYIVDAPRDRLAAALQLTEGLPRNGAPAVLTFSGGVAEYILGHEKEEFGDIARMLAHALTEELGRRSKLPIVDPGQRIRATVIGASQFTVQVSGKTIFISDPGMLPVHNIPVVHIGRAAEGPPDRLVEAIRASMRQMDLEPEARMAIAFSWRGDPEYKRLARRAAPSWRRSRRAASAPSRCF